MARFLVLGAGRQGVACGTFLLERYAGTHIAYVDASLDRLAAVRDSSRTSTHLCDVSRNTRELEGLLADCDCVISCVPFFFNEALTRLAIDRGKHFCDLGGNVETVRRQLAMADVARAAGVCVVPDCGLAPGTVNVLAELWRGRWQYRSVKMLCGGLPQHPEGVLRYQANFSIHGLLNEYLDDCQVSRGGRVVTIPGLSELERVSGLALPGEFEAFATSGGASLGPELYAPLGVDYEYKTLRYPGHRDAIKAMAEVGLFEEIHLGDLVAGSPVVPGDRHALAFGSGELARSASDGSERLGPSTPRLRSGLVQQVGTRKPGYADLPVVAGGLAEIRPRDVAVALLEQAFASDRQDLVIARVEVRGTDEQGRPVEGRVDLLDRADERFTAMERTTGFSIGVVAAFLAGLLPEVPPAGVFVPFQVLPAGRLIDELAAAGVEVTTS